MRTQDRDQKDEQKHDIEYNDADTVGLMHMIVIVVVAITITSTASRQPSPAHSPSPTSTPTDDGAPMTTS